MALEHNHLIDWIDNKKFRIRPKDDPPGEQPLIYATFRNTTHHFELLARVSFTESDECTHCHRMSIIDFINQVTVIPFMLSHNEESLLSLLLCNWLIVKCHVPHDIRKFSEHVRMMDPNGYLALEGQFVNR